MGEKQKFGKQKAKTPLVQQFACFALIHCPFCLVLLIMVVKSDKDANGCRRKTLCSLPEFNW
jgi:hypothetical protein